jgi:hypothetical protein
MLTREKIAVIITYLEMEFCMSYPYTVTGAREFLDYLINKGLLNANTGGSMKSACEKLFSVLDENEKQSLKGLDVEAAVKRFANKYPGTLSPDSLGVYRSRVQKVLALLDRFNLDPASFKVDFSPRAKTADASNGSKKPSTPHGQTKSERSRPVEVAAQTTSDRVEVASKSDAVTLMFPLRPDFIAQFVIPKELSLREAKKLAAYFELIAVDYEPS